MMTEDSLMMILVTLLSAWVLWLLFRSHQSRTKVRLQRNETFRHLIDKFAAADEFVAFLKSPEGQALIEEPATGSDPLPRVRRQIQVAIILLVLGGAQVLNAMRLRGLTDANYVNNALGMKYWATIFVAGGIALLLVAWVSYRLTARR